MELIEEAPEVLIMSVSYEHGVGEVYSPPRVVPISIKHGFKGGWSLDRLVKDADGRSWDFDDPTMRERAKSIVARGSTLLVIGSPMCTYFSNIMNIAKLRMKPDDFERKYAHAVSHLEFMFELFDIQLRNGGHILFEHPASASSWSLPFVVEMSKRPGMKCVVAHMCCFGMSGRDHHGPGLVLKPTKFLTSSPCIAAQLARSCSGGHRHISSLNAGGLAQFAIYPPALCHAIATGLAQQRKADSRARRTTRTDIPTLALCEEDADEEDMPNLCDETDDEDRDWRSPGASAAPQESCRICGFDEESEEFVAFDDAKGGNLSVPMVREARRVEMKFVKDLDLYEYRPVSECFSTTGAAPINTKWVDTNKGDDQNPAVRSRLVAMECRKPWKQRWFAATPPIETLRLFVAIAAVGDPRAKRRADRPRRMLHIDVSRAHWYPEAVRDVYVKLPAEDPRGNDPSVCGKLKHTMYGTLDAAQRWTCHYTKILEDAGFAKGSASPCHFHHPARNIYGLVHGDDFIFVADDDELTWCEQQLKAHYVCKSIWLGPSAPDVQEARILGRVIRYEEWGIQYEADPVHAERLFRDLGLEQSKPVSSPWIDHDVPLPLGHATDTASRRREVASQRHLEPSVAQSEPSPGEEDGPLLEGESVTLFRSCAAILNYLALDRADLQFAAKELMRHLAEPREGDELRLKRAVRYLRGKTRLVLRFPWHQGSTHLTAYVDGNFAGCVTTRKSTSAGVIQWGKMCLKTWSKTQATIALSSGESELAAVCKGAAELLGLQSVFADFGFNHVRLHLCSDATAAIGIVDREGLGRVRHLATGDLWIQQRVRNGDFSISKWPGKDNVSDIGTKGVDGPTLSRHLNTLGYILLAGRAECAPALKSTAGSRT